VSVWVYLTFGSGDVTITTYGDYYYRLWKIDEGEVELTSTSVTLPDNYWVPE